MNAIAIRRCLATGLALLALFIAAPAAQAQTTQGLQVKPAIIEDKVQPGQTYQFSVKVTNISTVERTFAVSAQDIEGLDDQGLPIFAQPGQATGYSLSQWVTLPSSPVTLAPGETKEIPFSVQVPSGASPGAHFGGVFFDSSGQAQSGNSSAVAMKVGTIVSLQIAGDVLEDSRLREFSTDKLVYDAASVTFNARIENQGNVLARPHGIIEITDMLGKKVASITVNDAGAPIFPGSVRSYSALWQDGGFAFGRYQALLSVSYGGDSKKTITAATSFWVLPFKLIGLVLGSIIALALVLYLWVHFYLKRKLQAMGGGRAADSTYYGRRYQRSGSRLMLALFVLVALCILILGALFLLFA